MIHNDTFCLKYNELVLPDEDGKCSLCGATLRPCTDAETKEIEAIKNAKVRLEYLRGEIEAERISTSEIVELVSLKKYINNGDTLLLEWAGVPEFPDEE